MSIRELPNSKSEIIEALLQFKGTFYSIGIFTACINIILIAPALYMMQVYDRVLASRNEETLFMLSFILIAMLLVMALLERVRSMVIIKAGKKIDAFLNERVFNAAFRQNLKKDGINAGQALNDLNTIRQFMTGSSIFAFFEAPWFPIYLALIFFFNFWLGLFALVGTGTLFFLAWLNEYLTGAALKKTNSLAIQSSQITTNNLRNAEVIEAMGMLPNLRNRWYETHSQYLALQADVSKKAASINAATKFVRILIQSLILGIAAYLVISGYVSPGMMIAASVLLGRATAPVEQIIGIWRQWDGVRDAYHRLTQLLQNNPRPQETMTLPAPLGNLEVFSLRASPPGAEHLVLKGVSFKLNQGDVLGIVGPSGAGKTTLARILVGVFPILSGDVRLDGSQIGGWNKEELGPSIGYLPQDIELFSGTIAENIARFGPVESEKVIKAAQLAGVHNMILKMPNGYDTKIGDAGFGLSGGQKQRIGLARALFGEPSFIVLDEPSSNLDEAGEVALTRAIEKLRQLQKTTVVISHRNSTIKVTNKLLILNDGQVQAFGLSKDVIEGLNKAGQRATAQNNPSNLK
jgi:ATP-binding cassette, subfamily C, bacterial exporter for protease/lipase